MLNYVATSDWVVAFFPKVFQVLRLQDLGAGGHDGFTSLDSQIQQVEYFHGQHSAALIEENWEAIAHFIVHGTVDVRAVGAAVRARRNRFVENLGRAPYMVWIALFTVIGVGAWALLSLRAAGSTSLLQLASANPRMPLAVLAIAIYVWGIKSVLTKL